MKVLDSVVEDIRSDDPAKVGLAVIAYPGVLAMVAIGLLFKKTKAIVENLA